MNTISASFEVRNLASTNPDDYPEEDYPGGEYDVIARCSDGTLRHSDPTFDTHTEALEYAKTCVVQVATGSENLDQWSVVSTGQPTWSGSPCPLDPDNFWIDDKTGERVNAQTGERCSGGAA